MSIGGRQSTLLMTGEPQVLEHGPRNRYGRGGVYDEAGEFDLHATKELLAERFAETDEKLPDRVGPFERKHSQAAFEAVYYREGPFEGSRGNTTSWLYIRVFPVGPHLHRWTVGIEERQPKYATNPGNGCGYWNHPDASDLDDPGSAAATALALMQGRIPLDPRSAEAEANP